MFDVKVIDYPLLANLLTFGFAVTIFLSIFIHTEFDEKRFRVNFPDAEVHRIGKFTYKPQVIWAWIGIAVDHFAVMFCIVTIGGITDALWVTSCIGGVAWEQLASLTDYIALFFAGILFLFLPIFLTYFVGFFIMGLYKFTKKYSQIIFIVTFLVSIVFFSGYIFLNKPDIEVTTEVIEQTEERELVFFYELPVQQVSGSVSGSSFHGSGTVSGEIFTVDVVPYVYLNAEGKGEWGSAPTADSDITFFAEKDTPKIVIVTKISREIEINHTSGESEVINEKKTVEYHFYLPQSILQTFEAE